MQSEELFLAAGAPLALAGKAAAGANQLRIRSENALNRAEIATAAALSGFFLVSKPEEEENGHFFIVERPSFSTGVKQTLPKRRVVLDLADESNQIEFVDENALLEKEDFERPTNDDCETSKDGTRKACKNCTCGRADSADSPESAAFAKKTVAQASSCGNCYLGDAFRCASCPHLGKPAFKAGQENVMLDLTDDI